MSLNPGTELMSTSAVGRAKRIFIKGMRLCPPASTRDSSHSCCKSLDASASDFARWYEKGYAYTGGRLASQNGWSAVQTKALIAARILLRLPRRSKVKPTSVLGQFPMCAVNHPLMAGSRNSRYDQMCFGHPVSTG